MRRLLSGNEAIAYGAYLGGVKVASAYPGTPSTEILENFAKYDGVYAEWAPNEKVALDVAIGAAYSGVRALAAMKHVGLNVASDSLFYGSYTGLKAGLVVVTADDPNMYSSQNEQDNRHYAKFAKLPMLEPSDSEEAKRYVLLALEISERFDTPVLLRSVTRISHSKSPVEMEEGPPRTTGAPPAFVRDPEKLVMIPGYARKRHPVVEERMLRLAEYAEGFGENRIEEGDPALGIITGGISYQYAREVFPDASFLKLGMSWPLPANLIRRFAGGVSRLLVVEELDPFYEEAVRLLGIEATGKKIFPLLGELSPQAVRKAAAKEGLVEAPPETPSPGLDLPMRPPVLCPGCGHRGVFYALRRLGALSFGDIGCYTLGVMPPLQAIDTCGCMGASIGVLHGVEKAGVSERKVAVIGDSTFFHAGIPALMNLVYNRGTSTTVILDNRITAMTGHQDNPGTGRTLLGQEAPQVDMEALVRSMGIEQVVTMSPYDVEGMRRTLKAFMESGKPSVLIARHPCVLYTREKYPVPFVDEELCTNCGVCLRIGCPPILQAENRVEIDELLCQGCGLCITICPYKAIRRPDGEVEKG